MKIKDWENKVFSKYNVNKISSKEEINNYYNRKFGCLKNEKPKKFYSCYISQNKDLKSVLLTTSEDLKNFSSSTELERNCNALELGYGLNYIKSLNGEKASNISKWEDYYLKSGLYKKITWEELPNKYKEIYLNGYSSIGYFTEGYISENELYAIYIFDNNSIAKRETFLPKDAEWKATIIFLSTKDNNNILNMFIQQSPALTREEYKKFLKEVWFE